MQLIFPQTELAFLYGQLVHAQPEEQYEWLTLEELSVVVNSYLESKWDDFAVSEKVQEIYKRRYPDIKDEELEHVSNSVQEILFCVFESVFTLADEDFVTAEHINFVYEKDMFEVNVNVIPVATKSASAIDE